MLRTILAFNGDLESRLALHWLVHEQNYEVISLSINLGQEKPLYALGEEALDLGAVAAQVVDCRELLLKDFALPVLRAQAIYQGCCFLGSALGRYVIAAELVQLAEEENVTCVAHAATSKGNDQVRMETAIAALAPNLKVLAPVRNWNLKSWQDKITYAQRHAIDVKETDPIAYTIDKNLWEVSLYGHHLQDAWVAPPDDMFILTKAAKDTPDTPTEVTISFEQGIPVALNEEQTDLVSLVEALTKLGGEHGIGRYDVVEDRLFGIKSREFYEAPAATLLLLAHRELENLVHSKELRRVKMALGRQYAELVYSGLWFHELRTALDAFFFQSQERVTGDVRLQLNKGSASVIGRKSPYSLYNAQLANQSNMDLFENKWAEGFTTLWTLSSRLAAERQKM